MQTRPKPAGTAVHVHVLERTVYILTRLWRTTLIEIEVVRNKQIELAIPVVVDPGAARAPTGPVRAQSGFPGYVGKSAVPIIVVEDVLAPVRDEQILKPIVIVVEECAATPHGFDDIVFAVDAAVNGGGVQAGRLRHIGESSEKRDAGRFSARCRLHSAGGNALRAQIDGTTQKRKACHEADEIAAGGLHVISVSPGPANLICQVAGAFRGTSLSDVPSSR